IGVAVAEQRIAGSEVQGLELVEHALPNLGQDLEHLVATWQIERAANATRMLERIVDPRHLAEFDFAVHVPREPHLLEVCDVAEIPDDWTHQRIVLHAQVFIAERLDEPNRSSACLAE